MTKPELRHRLKAKRQALTPAEVASNSQAIIRRIIAAVDCAHVRQAHCYRPIEGTNEVNTDELIEWMGELGAQVTLPGRIISPAELATKYDLIIVPIIGFDSECNRLGYGGGYYDRLLAAQPQAQTVGLAYDLSLVSDGLPVEPHDVALDMICTETTTYASSSTVEM